MNDYHDHPTGDPHTVAEDRAVAGWPGHNPDEHKDEHVDEHTDETPREGELLVGEVWNEEPVGEHDAGAGSGWAAEHGRHEQTGESGLAEGERPEDAEEADRDRVGEPFGSEEPMIVTEVEGAESEPVTAAEPVEAARATEPEAEPVVEGARPTAADELAIEYLLEPEAAERLRDRWRDVKGVFVDDPSDAVQQASALSGEAVDELIAALGRLRKDLDDHWDDGKETDTERLRVALRGYGSLIDRILTR